MVVFASILRVNSSRLAAVAAFAAILLGGQLSAKGQRGRDASGEAAAIAWYGSWSTGLAAAKKSGRPILLIAAAPHCHGVSGIW